MRTIHTIQSIHGPDGWIPPGCPGGPGHPGSTSRQFAEGAIEDLIKAAHNGDLRYLEAPMLSMCQCSLVEVIDILIQQAATDPHDVVA
jgi:hypothetical protein